METIVAGGLLVLVVVAVMLHMEDRRDQRRIEQATREYQAALDRANALEAEPERHRTAGTKADMRDWSCRHENGPQIAKSEGVQRGSGSH